MEDLKHQYLDEMKLLINSEYHDEIKIVELKENFDSMSIEINKKEKLLQLEQLANLSTYPSKHFNSFCYDDDDDEDYAIAVTPILSTEEPENSLSMGDEHLDTIPATESDEFIKSSFENLVPIPSEFEGESKCDVPVTLEDKRKCDVPNSENSTVCDNHSDIFFDSKIDDDISVYDDDFEDIKYFEATLPDPEIVSEEENVVQQEEEEVDLEDISQIQDIVLREKL
nr:hypothetical protein [Tanacetum cinerariifolium]